MEEYVIGWKRTHIIDLVLFIEDDERTMHIRAGMCKVLVLPKTEYTLAYTSEVNELSVYHTESGLWVFSIDLDSGAFQYATAMMMNSALVDIFNCIGVTE